MLEFSIVIPVYNEEESLDPLFTELKSQMDSLKRPYEIIFVDDCSADNSLTKMEGYQRKFPSLVQVIRLPQRSGQTYAMRQGLAALKGAVAITLDADLQNDPADIPKLLKKMQAGYDMVCGWRKDRMDLPLKKSLSKFGNVLQRSFSGLKIHDVSCTLRAFKRECIPYIALDWEGQHRFIPLSVSKKGYKVGEVVSHHRQRKFGYSKYSHKRIFKVVTDFFKVLKP